MLRYDDDDIHPVDRYESARKLDITAAFWAALGGRRALQRPVPRHGQALGARAQAAHPRGDRRDHRRARRPRCPRPSAACGTGTTASCGSATRRSPSPRSTPWATAREADAFMRFLKKVCRHEGGGHLQIMYGIDGRRDLVERQLDHLSGYRGSRPVRVGNGAAGQLQLDVYGEVLETADIWRRNHEMTEGTWRVLRGLVDWVSRNWQLPDSSIWEVRGEVRHYVFSKVMSWVALDRGVRMAEELGLEGEHRRVAGPARHAARGDPGARVERAAPVVHAGLRRRRARRRGAGHPDGAVPSVEPSAGRRHRARGRARAHQRRRRAGVSLPASRMDWRARKGRSRSAPSGWRRP